MQIKQGENVSKRDQDLIKKIDETISELVHEKLSAKKAFDYYNNVLDPNQFAHYESNDGIGSPSSVEYIPLIRKHINALVGDYIESNSIVQASIKDNETISKIDHEKQEKIREALFNGLNEKMISNLKGVLSGRMNVEMDILEYLKAIESQVAEEYVSTFEIAAQNIIEHAKQSNEIELKEKQRKLGISLFVSGESYYDTPSSENDTEVQVEVLSVLNTFVDLGYNMSNVRDSDRAVVRRWMTLPELLRKYGNNLTDDDIKDLKDNWESHSYSSEGNFWIDRVPADNAGYPGDYGVMADYRMFGYHRFDPIHYRRFIPVYEVQWIDTEKEIVPPSVDNISSETKYRWRSYRYKNVRIGNEIYLLYGKDETAQRSISNPDKVFISIGGVVFMDNSNKPFSLALECSSLQDKYNLLWFYKDNILHAAGTTGERLDLAKLPKFLGKDTPERLIRWLAYKRKAGIALYDSSQEGALESQNTNVGDFDDTLRLQSIEAIERCLQSVDYACSTITGVTQERLGGVKQYEAVSNVEMGVKHSYTVTRQYTHQLDLLTARIFVDILNSSKRVYKNGISGVIILGEDRHKVFTSSPESFTMTDHDVHVVSSSEAKQDLENTRAIAMKMAESGGLPPDVIIEVVDCKSATDMKRKMKEALSYKKIVTQKIEELSKVNSEMEAQLKEAKKSIEAMSAQIDQYKEKELQYKIDASKAELEVMKYKAETERAYRENKAQVDRDKVDIELKQLRNNNPYDDNVRFD